MKKLSEAYVVLLQAATFHLRPLQSPMCLPAPLVLLKDELDSCRLRRY